VSPRKNSNTPVEPGKKSFKVQGSGSKLVLPYSSPIEGEDERGSLNLEPFYAQALNWKSILISKESSE